MLSKVFSKMFKFTQFHWDTGITRYSPNASSALHTLSWALLRHMTGPSSTVHCVGLLHTPEALVQLLASTNTQCCEAGKKP